MDGVLIGLFIAQVITFLVVLYFAWETIFHSKNVQRIAGGREPREHGEFAEALCRATLRARARTKKGLSL